jgi:hypothetical protein
VLELAIGRFRGDALATCRTIIGTVILLEAPLSIADLANLLGLTQGRIRGTLQDLHSVVSVPDTNSNGTLHTFHASFYDFLTNENRSISNIFIQTQVQHGEIALCLFRCLERGLRRNISNIDRFKFHSEVEDLDERNTQMILQWLRYACRFWAYHLTRSSTTAPTTELVDASNTFIRTKLLFWIEVLSLLGDLGLAVSSLNDAKRWCSVSDL